MLAGKMMDEFTTKDKQVGSHEYNTVQQGYSAHINININNRRLVSPWLAQLGERRSAEREVAGSNPGRTNT